MASEKDFEKMSKYQRKVARRAMAQAQSVCVNLSFTSGGGASCQCDAPVGDGYECCEDAARDSFGELTAEVETLRRKLKTKDNEIKTLRELVGKYRPLAQSLNKKVAMRDQMKDKSTVELLDKIEELKQTLKFVQDLNATNVAKIVRQKEVLNRNIKLIEMLKAKLEARDNEYPESDEGNEYSE